MKFIYLDEQGNPIGPVDESVIVQGIRAGNLTAQTAIRNALLREFRTLAEFDCFADELAQAAPPASAEAENEFGLSDLAYLRHLSLKQVHEELNSTISAKLFAADAKVLRRLAAMLMDAVILLPVLAVIFLPAITSFRHLGTLDTAELERQKNAKEIQKIFVRTARQQEEPAVAAEENQEDADQPAPPRKAQPHDSNRALVNRLLPGVLEKLPNAYMPGNAQLLKDTQDSQKNSISKRHPSGANADKSSAKKKTRSNQRTAKQEAAKKLSKDINFTKKTTAAYLLLPAEERPQVLLVNMPGGKILSRFLPGMVQQWEDHLYADGIHHSADAKSVQGMTSNLLITGCARVEDGILLRIGNDIYRFNTADLAAHFSRPVKWAALVLLLYYTFAFSIFAQTVGMWFWGIFLTRTQLAEVLSLRALLYTMTMLIFGILMIPAVLITGRSVADWLCGVRQVGVGSVSKAS